MMIEKKQNYIIKLFDLGVISYQSKMVEIGKSKK